MLRFKKGDQVVYPRIGQGKIIEISYREFCGEEKLYYKLELERVKNSIIYISVESSERLGLRKAMTREDIPEVMAILQKHSSVQVILGGRRSSERYIKQTEILRMGGFQGLALVVSNLYDFFRVNTRRPGLENNLYKASFQELGQELSMALGVDFKEAEEMIRKALAHQEEKK